MSLWYYAVIQVHLLCLVCSCFLEGSQGTACFYITGKVFPLLHSLIALKKNVSISWLLTLGKTIVCIHCFNLLLVLWWLLLLFVKCLLGIQEYSSAKQDRVKLVNWKYIFVYINRFWSFMTHIDSLFYYWYCKSVTILVISSYWRETLEFDETF